MITTPSPSGKPGELHTSTIEVLQPPVESAQYTALRFSQRLTEAGVAASMGSTGDSFENAMAESFFGTIKTELLYRRRWATRHEADMAISDWIEGLVQPPPHSGRPRHAQRRGVRGRLSR